MRKYKSKLKESEIKMFESLADDFIALKFKEQHYNSVITFVEIMLKRLKHHSKTSNHKVIKDILGI